jgi:hypothetical protein
MRAKASFFYEAFGLTIGANRPLPGFMERQPGEVDIEIEWSVKSIQENGGAGDRVLYQSEAPPGAAPYFSVSQPIESAPHYLRCRCTTEAGQGRFDIDAGGRRIEIVASPGLPHSDLMAYLMGPVMGCTLRLRGITCMHAAVVKVDNRAIALMGPKGSGKSTLTAALAAMGYPVLTDDIAAISNSGESLMVSPAYSRLRLWPDAQQYVPALSMKSLPRVLSTMDKRYQPLTADPRATSWRFSTQSTRLAALYHLGTSATNKAEINAMPLPQAIMILMSNVYAGYLDEKEMRQRDLKLFGEIASGTAVCTALCNTGTDGFRDRCAAIIDHIESLSRQCVDRAC